MRTKAFEEQAEATVGAESMTYLVQTVTYTAELWWELIGGANNSLKETLCDLQQVPLVLLKVLPWVQPEKLHSQNCGIHCGIRWMFFIMNSRSQEISWDFLGNHPTSTNNHYRVKATRIILTSSIAFIELR